MGDGQSARDGMGNGQSVREGLGDRRGAIDWWGTDGSAREGVGDGRRCWRGPISSDGVRCPALLTGATKTCLHTPWRTHQGGVSASPPTLPFNTPTLLVSNPMIFFIISIP